MKPVTQRLAATLAVVLALPLLLPAPARAWETKSMQAVGAMAMQMLKGDYSDVFRPGGAVGPNFEKDVLAGARDGYRKLGDGVPLGSESEVVEAIANEIALLRAARKFGPTPYFAYRMGLLGSLTANAMLPFGFAFTEEDKALRQRIVADIEQNLDGYSFSPTTGKLQFVCDAQSYFRSRQSFMAQDKAMIKHDYQLGQGYRGFLQQGGPAYFTRSVEAVADVWNTVLNTDSVCPSPLPRPSDRALTWYFVSEIEFLVANKDSVRLAQQIYENFEKVNPRIPESYVRVGDIFYAHASREARERGVLEWQKAYSLGGPGRADVGKKLSAHFITEGRVFLEKAGKPGAEDTDLPNALNAFERGLDFDRTNAEVATLIEETNKAIVARNERLETTINIIANGEKIRAEADNFRDRKDFANAIKTYRQAIGFFEAVDDEFREQSNTAKENVRRLRKSIQDVISDILDTASAAIDEGDRAKDSNRFDDAIAKYDTVPTIVSVIPDDERQSVKEDKDKLVQLSASKKEEAKVAKIRYEQAMQEQAAAATAAPGGAAPAPAPAPAPAQ